MRQLWTEEEIKILKTMAAKGVDWDKMASVLKARTASGIRAKLQQLGVEIVSNVEIDYEQFKKLVGLSK